MPESPQHRAWREAHAAAETQIGQFRDQVAGALADASRLLTADPPAGSDAWFDTGGLLRHACRRLGSATYCLHEWAEPSDEQPHFDDQQEPTDAQLPQEERFRLRAIRYGRRSEFLRDGDLADLL